MMKDYCAEFFVEDTTEGCWAMTISQVQGTVNMILSNIAHYSTFYIIFSAQSKVLNEILIWQCVKTLYPW